MQSRARVEKKRDGHQGPDIFPVLGRKENTLGRSACEHAQRRRLYPVCGGDGGGTLAAECAASFLVGARSVWVTP